LQRLSLGHGKCSVWVFERPCLDLCIGSAWALAKAMFSVSWSLVPQYYSPCEPGPLLWQQDTWWGELWLYFKGKGYN
jgi:hypothetical protein